MLTTYTCILMKIVPYSNCPFRFIHGIYSLDNLHIIFISYGRAYIMFNSYHDIPHRKELIAIFETLSQPRFSVMRGIG